MKKKTTFVVAALMAFTFAAQATTIDLIPVGNPGNAGELSGVSAGGYGPDAIVGAVDYIYQIGKYEITAGQYTEFLNAVAETDAYGLYSTSMVGTYGCGIQRGGSSGCYTYSVSADWVNRPVNWVSWGDAARFCNWLHNGQPTGAQGPSTTEDGAYYLNGATTSEQLMAVEREEDAKWWIPSENEWYKAAYHKNDGVTGNYWDYPTGTDIVPSNDLLTPDPGNNANFYQDGYAIGSPYYMTVVGDFENSESPYGTFDQGGNLWEWNETVIYASSLRGARGGYCGSEAEGLHASWRDYGDPTDKGARFGFRVASVPEPGGITLLVCGAIGGLIWRRRGN
ncbi:MAG: SUMF1/EgtB/PvdO family nonheme iron enzyme [Pirellulales bacterium]|nr:SUMF1/EgtB/PvdO family nonheme iron enzyme [Pirellulales bacterium]